MARIMEKKFLHLVVLLRLAIQLEHKGTGLPLGSASEFLTSDLSADKLCFWP